MRGSNMARLFTALFGGFGDIREALCTNNCRGEEHDDMRMSVYNGVPDRSVLFTEKVLDKFRTDVGRFYPETGGMIASKTDKSVIDLCYFDSHSQNTSGSFYYDVESMSEVFRCWKEKGYVTNGIYHSHPRGMTRPSYHDISSALLHIDFFHLDYFYLPIFQTDVCGFYTMYFYTLSLDGDVLEAKLNYVVKADENGYKYAPFRRWSHIYSADELRAYRENTDRAGTPANAASIHRDKIHSVHTKPETTKTHDTDEYFSKVKSLYPESVLDKVIVCVGTGGARSFLENCARSGLRNYILMDADVVSPSNIATQSVFVSEIGRKKVEVIRDRILDINPAANVICVDRFLDDSMSDEEFRSYMDRFPGRRPTDYLILGCTDNFQAQKRSSLLALKYGTPYLAAMMYEGGAAAEIIFVYPGVTASCPRCLLRDRFEKYEHGFVNDVDSSACPIFATERMNSLKGYIALMLLMYHEDDASPFSRMLDEVKDRNFVQIRLTPYLKDSKLAIGLFDRALSGASRYVYFDETLWIHQHPDSEEYGEKNCLLCGGVGDLTTLADKWVDTDTRSIKEADL